MKLVGTFEEFARTLCEILNLSPDGDNPLLAIAAAVQQLKMSSVELKCEETAKVLNGFYIDVWKNAEEKGMYESERRGLWLMFLHGEVSELWEAFRKGRLNEACDKGIDLTYAEEEIADVILTALVAARELGIMNVGRALLLKHAYNKTREFQHGDAGESVHEAAERFLRLCERQGVAAKIKLSPLKAKG